MCLLMLPLILMEQKYNHTLTIYFITYINFINSSVVRDTLKDWKLQEILEVVVHTINYHVEDI